MKERVIYQVTLHNGEPTLSRFIALVSFFAPGFLMISRGTERRQRHEMDQFSMGTSL